MKIINALVSVASASIAEWADNYCGLMSTLSGYQTHSKEDEAEAFNKFKSSFADTIDCSIDPNNAEFGFDLTDATIEECQAADFKSKQNMKHFEAGEVECIQKIIDEEAGTAAIWLDFANTGKFTAKVKARAAIRFAIEDGKATSYHGVYDTYNFIDRGSTPVQDWVDNYCELAAKTAGSEAGKEITPAEMEKMYQDFASLWAAKIDCSEDPANPDGYDLAGATFQECADAKATMMKGWKKFDQGAMSCLDTIVDEAESKAAVWIQYGNNGDREQKFTMRAAIRFEIAGGVATSYHAVYDSYHFEQAIELAQSRSPSLMIAGAMGLAAFAFVAVMKLHSRKQAPLLANEVA